MWQIIEADVQYYGTEYLEYITRPGVLFSNYDQYLAVYWAWCHRPPPPAWPPEEWLWRGIKDSAFADAALEVMTHPGAVYLGRGTSRTCWRIGNLVFKIPNSPKQLGCNQNERVCWTEARGTEARKRLAPCWLTRDGILVMRVVEIPGSGHAADNTRERHPECPGWAHHIDSCQVGKYKDRWVAYDYGYETPNGTWATVAA